MNNWILCNWKAADGTCAKYIRHGLWHYRNNRWIQFATSRQRSAIFCAVADLRANRVRIPPPRTRFALSTFCREIWEMIYSRWSVQRDESYMLSLCADFFTCSYQKSFSFLTRQLSNKYHFTLSVLIFNSLEIRSCA